MSKADADKRRTIVDRDWWIASIPSTWKLVCFTDREHALLQSPTGRGVNMDGELLVALAATMISN
jgi:hypothetical protein